MKFQNHLSAGILGGIGFSYGLNYIGLFDGQNINVMIFCLLIILGSISNDLDNVSSKIGKLFFFISIPSHVISYLFYKIFYKKSFDGTYKAIRKNNGFFSTHKLLFSVKHRMLYHSDIGIYLISYLGYLLYTEFNINLLYTLAFIIGYCIHLLLDYIHGKLPIPFILRIIFIIFGIRKEMFGLNLRIGG